LSSDVGELRGRLNKTGSGRSKQTRYCAHAYLQVQISWPLSTLCPRSRLTWPCTARLCLAASRLTICLMRICGMHTRATVRGLARTWWQHTIIDVPEAQITSQAAGTLSAGHICAAEEILGSRKYVQGFTKPYITAEVNITAPSYSFRCTQCAQCAALDYVRELGRQAQNNNFSTPPRIQLHWLPAMATELQQAIAMQSTHR
jgi:hypothetical protein